MTARRLALGLERSAAAWLLLLAIACEHPSASAPEAQLASSAIIAQALVSAADANRPGTGLVRVHGSGGECVGQMLTRQWVITAAHCFCADDVSADATKTSSTVSVTLGSESAAATLVQLHPTQDAALLRLERMLPLASAVALWPNSAADLVQEQVECQGFDHGLADAGVATSTLLRVTSAANALGSVTAQCSGSVVASQVDGFTVAPVDAEEDAGATFQAFDGGAPCFVERGGVRYLAGSVAAPSSNDPKLGWVVGIDGLASWIRATTDIWSDAECTTDVPGTKFAIDPMVFAGAPNAATVTLVARHAYGVKKDQKVIVQQTTGTHFSSWTVLPSPPNTDDILAAGASMDFNVVTQYGAAMSFFYLDGDHTQRGFEWYDAGSSTWVAPGFLPFTGSGSVISTVSVRVGMDYSNLMPFWVTDQGRVGASIYVGETYVKHTLVNALIDLYLPADAPVGDASRRPTAIFNTSSGSIYGGFRSLAGQFVTYAGSSLCFALSDSSNPWCPGLPVPDGEPRSLGPVTVHDLPMADVRDVALGVTTLPSETFWVVTVGNDDQMRLWLLSTSGKAKDYGAIGDRALGMVKMLQYAATPGGEVLFASYTGAAWSARVRPVGNCLGNTPPGWQ